jgi:hypothetical protein
MREVLPVLNGCDPVRLGALASFAVGIFVKKFDVVGYHYGSNNSALIILIFGKRNIKKYHNFTMRELQ